MGYVPNSAGNNPNGSQAQLARGGRRKEDLKIDDIAMGKFAKKMVSNWVGTNSSQQPGQKGSTSF